MKEQDSKRWSEKSKKKRKEKKSPLPPLPSSQHSAVEMKERKSCRRMKTNIFITAMDGAPLVSKNR